MDHTSIKEQLEIRGYAVVKDVLTPKECDGFRDQYNNWLKHLFDEDRWPSSTRSLIQKYRIGHLEPSWCIRLKTKPIFASLFSTEKLLSSIDAVAIGKPPEDGQTEFHIPGQHWLHLDQSGMRIGFHAYQGGVYLEDAEEDDWTLEVMENSHKFHSHFFKENPEAAERAKQIEFCRLMNEEVEWYKRQGCPVKRVPVPKGGMVLWDSRTVHANAQPIKGRKHPGRWRYVVFVCMTPAIWASPKDMEMKKAAYQNIEMTTHWPSQGVAIFPESKYQRYNTISEIPDVAKCEEARLLCGDLKYDFKDGKPNGPPPPKWAAQWGRCVIL